MAKAHLDISLSKFGGAWNIFRGRYAVSGAYMAGDAVLEYRVQEAGHVGCVVSGTHQFSHKRIGMGRNLLWRDAVELVVFLLLLTAAGGFTDCLIHGFRDGIGIHYHKAVEVTGCAAGGLGKGASAPEEPFFIGIQNGHKGYGGDVQAFPQEVYADKYVKEAVLEILYDLYAFRRVYVRVDIPAADAGLLEVAVQFLGHALGERGYKHPLVPFGPYADLFHKVVHLVFGGTDLDGRVQEAGGAHDLLHHKAFGLLKLIIGRGGAHVNRLACYGFEFVEGEGTVVTGGGEAETVFHQGFLAGVVSAVHCADLGEGDVGLVYEHQEILGEVVYEGEGTLAGLSPVKVTGIVLNARAVAHLLYHLYVVFYPLFQAFSLKVFAN